MADFASSIDVYPREGQTYPDAAGVPITATGATVDRSEYILEALRDSYLLTQDPLGIYQPENRTSGGVIVGGRTFTSFASLSASLGLLPNEGVELLGYYAPGDGGGGTFYWALGDSTTADGGCVAGSSLLGRWKRIFSGPRYAKWYGAKGDDAVTDDTARLQAFIDSIPAGGCGVLDVGRYRVTDGLICGTPDVTFRGDSGRHAGFGAQLVWDGLSSSKFLWTFSGVGQNMENISFRTLRNLRGFVECGSIAGSLSGSAHLKGLSMYSGQAPTDPTYDYGIAVGFTSPSANNQEYMQFEDIGISNALVACWYLGGNPNALGHVFKRCGAANYMGDVGARKYVEAGLSDGKAHAFGCGVKLVGGNQVAFHQCAFSALETWVEFNGSQDRDYIHFYEVDSEYCKKAVYGNFPNAGHVVIDGSRCIMNRVELSSIGPIGFAASDHKYFELTSGPHATLELRSCSMGVGDQITNLDDTVSAPYVIATGCSLSGAAPFTPAASHSRIYAFGNRGSAGTTTTPILDGLYQIGGFVYEPAHFSGIQTQFGHYHVSSGSGGSLPAINPPRRNTVGTVTISGAATTSVVAFSATEQNNGYTVRLTPVSFTGSPATGSKEAVGLSKTTTGFTATCDVAPGVGNSVTFAWEIIAGAGF